jgi:hypothetical protein
VPADPRFVLYVEGPRDRSLLEAWAWSVSPPLARALPPVTVILGGCQPARAAAHFRDTRTRATSLRAVCVLDRDRERRAPPPTAHEAGLEFFTWGRRHIESYLLVPAAIRRSLRLRADDARLERFFRDALPAVDDEEALGHLDAKPLFAERGELAQLLGRPVPPARVARAMRSDELHADVHDLLGRLREGLGLGEPATAVRRAPRG